MEIAEQRHDTLVITKAQPWTEQDRDLLKIMHKELAHTHTIRPFVIQEMKRRGHLLTLAKLLQQ